jgi:Protein of unknown function with HXXEE motif
MKPEILIWLFPIVFMVHEFEEIIFMRWWVKKNKEHILVKYPKLGKRVLGQYDGFSTEAFSLIVAEEFLIVSFIVVFSVATSNYDLYAGLIIAFSIHLLIHLIQSIALRSYTPAIITTFITGVFCGYTFIILKNSYLLSFNRTLIFSSALTLIVFLNLKVMYSLVRRIKILN